MNRKLLLMMSGAVGVFLVFLIAMGISQSKNNTPEQPKPKIASFQGNDNIVKIVSKDITKELFPKEIVGLKLEQLLDGEAAKQQISQLHGTDIPADDAFVASYKKDLTDTLNIWISEYESTQDAEKLVAQMHEKIGASPVFQDHQTVPIKGIEYHFVTGMGQSHYFYYKGNAAIWVGIGSKEEMKILTEIIKTF